MNETPPRKIGRRSKRFWKDVTSKYQLRIDELVVLEDICHEMDIVDKLERKLEQDTNPNDGEGIDALVTIGSMKQPAAHPSLAEIRQHRALISKLIAQLKLPDIVEDQGQREKTDGETRSERMRAVANARWNKTGDRAAS